MKPLKTGMKYVRGLCAFGMLICLFGLTGCPFFVCEGKADCGTSSTSTGSGDYVYVSNSTSGSTYINGYEIGTNTLTAIANSPFQLNYEPIAMAVSANNEFLYVAASPTSSSAGIWLYTIGSDGELSGGTQETQTLVGAMALSPDGYFLYTLDSETGTVLNQYPLNTSNGLLGTVVPVSTSGGGLTGCALIGSPLGPGCSIAVAPTLDYLAVALNGTGVEYYAYTSSATGGAAATGTLIGPLSGGQSGDFSLAFDDSDFLYVASTAALTSYGNLSNTTAVTQPASFTNYSGATPRSVTVSTGYNYLYTANENVTGQIEEFTLSTNGSLMPFTTLYALGPQYVSALAVDRSGTYLLAAGYNSTNGLQLLTISSTTLSAVASVGTGATTTVPSLLALTHS